MKKKGSALLIGISMALILVVAGGFFFGGAEDARIERLKTLQVPADGGALSAGRCRRGAVGVPIE